MRKGFLAGDSPGGSRAARGVQENGGPEPLSTRERAAHETASLNTGSDASEATLPPNDGASLPQAISGHAVRSQSSIGLDHCLELLQGPSDERRLAGLLLVTRLLPQVSLPDLVKIQEAVGATFLNRLLLPLFGSQTPLGDQPAQVPHVESCQLALAILASFLRIPQYAETSQILAKTPLFMKVILAGGVAALLSPQAASHPQAAAADPAIESSLEIACAIAGSKAQSLAIESGAVRAASRTLVRIGAQHRHIAALSLRLLSASLDSPMRLKCLTDEWEALAAAVPPLTALLAAPVASSPAAPRQQEAGRGAEVQPHADALALQLDALHVLLLILPVPLPQAAQLQARLARDAAAHAAWLEQARDGVHLLLRSRIGPRQRHGALQLAAALTGLAGSAWLLGSSRDHPAGSFFQLLIQLLKVELHLALRDALDPFAPVPSSSDAVPMPTPPQAEGLSEPSQPPPDGSAHENGDAEGAKVEAIGDGLPEMHAVAGIRHLNLDEAYRDKTPPPEAPARDAELPKATPAAPPGLAPDGRGRQTAGERAAQVLPAVLELVEACIDALAQDCEAAEAIASGRPVLHATLQTFSDKEATGLAEALSEAADMLLQYLEAQAEQPNGLEPEMCLAVARCLGRYLADAPTTHAPRVQKLLPRLLTMQRGAATDFLCPALWQLAAPEAGTLDEPTAREWLQVLQSKQVLEPLLDRLDSTLEQASGSRQPGTGTKFPGDDSAMADADLHTQLQGIGHLLVNLLDSRQLAGASSDRQRPHAQPGFDKAVATLNSLSRWSRTVSSAPSDAPSLLDQGQETRCKLTMGLLAAQLLTVLASQGGSAKLPAAKVAGAFQMVLSTLQAGDILRLISAAKQKVALPMSAAGPLAEGDDIENELDVLDSMLADELWDRLLQAATLLAECLPAFAAAAAASKWVQEVIEGDYVENEAISDMELRLFCQTAVHNAPLQQF